jgi:hypothetical protein
MCFQQKKKSCIFSNGSNVKKYHERSSAFWRQTALCHFTFFFGRVGMEWPKFNILKNHKLILENNKYECVASSAIYRVYVKSKRNLSINFMNLNQKLFLATISMWQMAGFSSLVRFFSFCHYFRKDGNPACGLKKHKF